MYHFFQKYFALYKKGSLPGIGYFIAEKSKPAEVDFPNKIITPPVYNINFHTDENAIDEEFYSFLSNESGLTEEEACSKFNEFTASLHNQLLEGEELYISGIGILKRRVDEITFAADKTISSFFPEIAAEKVIRQNAEHFIKVGEDEKTSTEMQEMLSQEEVQQDRWWIGAIALGVLGLAAILYYYYVVK